MSLTRCTNCDHIFDIDYTDSYPLCQRCEEEGSD